MTTVRTFPAGTPLVGQWVVAWRTPRMPACAFWYFETQAEALGAANRLRRIP